MMDSDIAAKKKVQRELRIDNERQYDDLFASLEAALEQYKAGKNIFREKMHLQDQLQGFCLTKRSYIGSQSGLLD